MGNRQDFESGHQYTQECGYLGTAGNGRPPTRDYIWVPTRQLAFSVENNKNDVPTVFRCETQPYRSPSEQLKAERECKLTWMIGNNQRYYEPSTVLTPDQLKKLEQYIETNAVDPNPRTVAVDTRKLTSMQTYLANTETSQIIAKAATIKLKRDLRV